MDRLHPAEIHLITPLKLSESDKTKLKAIRAVIFDVDGVMTNGTITYDNYGNELKSFNVHDGHGIKAIQQAGIRVAIMSGRRSVAVERRAQELGITDLYQDLNDKSFALAEFAQLRGFSYSDLAHVGDDIADLVLFQHVGLAVAVDNAVPQVKRAADLVLTRSGGDGAIREICDLLLSERKE